VLEQQVDRRFAIQLLTNAALQYPNPSLSDRLQSQPTDVFVSKQLALSVALSAFAMAAFVLLATPNALYASASTNTGAKAQAFAPALGQAVAALPLISD
jgi:hypothetical protein